MNRSDLVSLKDPHERPMRLLAIYGGGIRAISCLYILKDIIQAIAPNTDLRHLPKRCEYFDFIAGTSSGGLLAIMLGYLRMSIMESIDSWEEIFKSVFDWPKSKTERRAERSHKHGLPKHFHTYGNEAQAEDVFIWETARATTAVPGFFAPVSINGVNYTDGGKHSPCRTIINASDFNNPAEQLELELRHIFGPQPIKIFASLGTGHVNPINMNLSKNAKEHPFGKVCTAWTLPNALVHLVTNTKAADARLGLCCRDSQNYLRFNIGGGLGSQALNEWDKIPDVVSRTQDYHCLWKTRQAIKRAAGMLVLTEADLIPEDKRLVEPDLQWRDNVDGFARFSAVLQGLAMTTFGTLVVVNPQLFRWQSYGRAIPSSYPNWQRC
ncbi:hypothetical protein MMC29_004071 [Sticta canariensis]|nr:hypothetical protein [Sticta canariensis]